MDPKDELMAVSRTKSLRFYESSLKSILLPMASILPKRTKK